LDSVVAETPLGRCRRLPLAAGLEGISVCVFVFVFGIRYRYRLNDDNNDNRCCWLDSLFIEDDRWHVHWSLECRQIERLALLDPDAALDWWIALSDSTADVSGKMRSTVKCYVCMYVCRFCTVDRSAGRDVAVRKPTNSNSRLVE
jgi:hypothetical protein